MANARRKRKKEFEISNSHLISIGLIGLGVIYLLSLISFSLNDLPTWVPFSHTTNPTRPATNFIGPPGAVWAGISFYTFGITSYLIPVMLIWLGSKRLFKLENLSKFEIVGFGLFLVSGSCLLHYQSWFLQSGHFNISGTGGIIGEFIGEKLTGMTGNVGSSIIMLTAYCSGGMLITRVHPSQIVKVGINSLKSFNTWREDRIFSKADETKKLLIQKKKLDKEQRRIEKKIDKTLLEEQTVTDVQSKKNNQIEEIVADPDINTKKILEENIKIEEDNTELSEPKIFDASFRSPEDSLQKKPSIAEVLAANKKSQNNKSGNDFSTPKEIQFPGYQLPDIELLNYDAQTDRKPTDKNLLIQTQKTIVETLDHFNVSVSAGDITRGPTITRYEIYPSKGLRVNRITALEADIARATKAERINILAPIPGKDTVGIEIANNEKVIVPLRELFDDPDFMDPKHKIPIALGKDVYGKAVIGDLAKMPHLLVAGATGAGKSVCINGIIASMLYRFTPDELRFIMIDPKVVEMQVYNSLPHQIVPVVTDSKKVILALRWVVNEMERRYQLFAKLNIRNFDAFNDRQQLDDQEAQSDEFFDQAGQAELDFENKKNPENSETENDNSWEYEYEEVEVEVEYEEGENDGEWNEVSNTEDEDIKTKTHSEDILNAPEPASNYSNEEAQRKKEIEESIDSSVEDEEKIPERLPYIVVIIDELADLMQTAPADVEQAIARIAQKARAAGIHLIIATQTPRADVVTGIIKANIPSRIAFQVSSSLDSRVILDNKGAEKLVGKGDMLYLPPGSAQLSRAQGALVTDEECVSVVDFCSNQATPIFAQEIDEKINGDANESEEISDEDEEIIEKCLEVIQVERRASTSLLQRRLRLGYTRAARMMDILEMRGIIGPGEGAKPREILVDLAN
ncbi:DNA translocase FtsK [Verrucomicrobiales bacterium]|nr:DNA translocase FtsK [Verrucomicrobiales bacterium]